jgi:hypothetical protein
MAVYVDDMRAPVGRLKLCHMVADSEDELLNMAHFIGCKRKWLQHKPITHFDICLSKRRKAVALGAIALTRREMGRKVREIKHRNQGELALEQEAAIEGWAGVHR